MNRERIKKFVGGQAVIEGVMMRGPGYTATAVREPAGTIVVQKEATKSIAHIYPILKKPFPLRLLAMKRKKCLIVKSPLPWSFLHCLR